MKFSDDFTKSWKCIHKLERRRLVEEAFKNYGTSYTSQTNVEKMITTGNISDNNIWMQWFVFELNKAMHYMIDNSENTIKAKPIKRKKNWWGSEENWKRGLKSWIADCK